MPRHSGRSGKVYAQVGAGLAFSALALTDSGDHLNYAVASAANAPWQDVPQPVVRLNGVTSGLVVIPDPAGANDKIAYSAGTAYLKGQKVSIVAGTVASLTRPATPADCLVNAIVLNEDGTVVKVAGTQAVAPAGLGVAGGQPYIGATQVLLATVTFQNATSSTAAPVQASEVDTNGQERADVPGFEVDYFAGGASLQYAIQPIHGSSGTPLTAAIYANGRIASLQQIFHLKEYSIEVGKDDAETMGFGDKFKKSVPTFRDWSGTASAYHVSPFWYQAANRDGYMLLQFQSNENDPYLFEGVANVKWGLKNNPAEATMETLTFKGNGELVLVPV